MSKLQLIALCSCVFVINTGISSVFGLMPLYLSHIGGDSNNTGGILAVAYVALACSTVAGGYLSNRLQRRTGVLIAGGALAAPLAWWLGRVTAAGPLLLATTCLWFVTGLALTMTNILAGLFAEPARRGYIFGMLSLSSGLGLFFGSLVSGPIVDSWGFTALFSLLECPLQPGRDRVAADQGAAASAARGPRRRTPARCTGLRSAVEAVTWKAERLAR